jgi:hypothetical protein
LIETQPKPRFGAIQANANSNSNANANANSNANSNANANANASAQLILDRPWAMPMPTGPALVAPRAVSPCAAAEEPLAGNPG